MMQSQTDSDKKKMAHHIYTIFLFNNEYETLVYFSNDVTLPTDNPITNNRQLQPLLLHWRPCRILQKVSEQYLNSMAPHCLRVLWKTPVFREGILDIL